MATFEDSGTDNADKSGNFSITLGAAPSAGDILIAVFSYADQGDNVNTVSNGLTLAHFANQYGTDATLEVWYVECAGTESATTTASMASGGSTAWMILAHYSASGALSFEAVDDPGQTGTSTTLAGSNPGSGSTAFNIVGGSVEGSNYTFSSPQSGWAIADEASQFNMSAVLIHNLTGTSADKGTVEVSTSDDWAATHLAFTEAAAGGQEILTLRQMGY
jgi:hypothetical protein